jgi:hypothetical protein
MKIWVLTKGQDGKGGRVHLGDDHDAQPYRVANFCLRWAGWAGVCVFGLALIVALSIRHGATARQAPAPTTPHGGYELTILTPTPTPHPAKVRHPRGQR